MYFEVYALSITSAAATEGTNRQKHFADVGSFAGDPPTDSSRKTCRRSAVSPAWSLTKIRREKAGAAATRRGRSGAAPLGADRRTGAEVGLEGFVLERTFYFDASTDR